MRSKAKSFGHAVDCAFKLATSCGEQVADHSSWPDNAADGGVGVRAKRERVSSWDAPKAKILGQIVDACIFLV
jgi:hypothetical protein